MQQRENKNNQLVLYYLRQKSKNKAVKSKVIMVSKLSLLIKLRV